VRDKNSPLGFAVLSFLLLCSLPGCVPRGCDKQKSGLPSMGPYFPVDSGVIGVFEGFSDFPLYVRLRLDKGGTGLVQKVYCGTGITNSYSFNWRIGGEKLLMEPGAECRGGCWVLPMSAVVSPPHNGGNVDLMFLTIHQEYASPTIAMIRESDMTALRTWAAKESDGAGR